MTTCYARVRFALKVKQLKSVKMNQLNNPAYINTNWKCPDCDQNGVDYNLDSQSHVTHCDSLKHLRENLDLDNEQHLVKYFQAVITHRERSDNVMLS